VVHVSLADPVCANLASDLTSATRASGAKVHDTGTYLCMEGPQFSTRAESHLYRSWGASVISMTAMQEARLAREAEMCYAALVLVDGLRLLARVGRGGRYRRNSARDETQRGQGAERGVGAGAYARQSSTDLRVRGRAQEHDNYRSRAIPQRLIDDLRPLVGSIFRKLKNPGRVKVQYR